MKITNYFKNAKKQKEDFLILTHLFGHAMIYVSNLPR